MIQSSLRRPLVRLLVMPNLQSRLLDGAGEGKRQGPGQARLEPDIHGIQTRRSQFGGLAARQERDPRNGSGHGAQETAHRGVGHFVHRRLPGTAQSRKHHIGLQDHPLQHHPLDIKLVENRSQDLLRYLGAALQGMRAVHEHFRFDDGDQSRFLAQGGIARQSMRIGIDASVAGNIITHGDHRTPLGETGAYLSVFGQAPAQSVQTLGYFLSGMTRHIFCAGIDLDAGDDARSGKNFDKGCAILLLLPHRLVVEDRAADALAQTGRGHDQFPPGAPGLRRLGNPQAGESFVAGGIAFIHRQQALVGGDHGPRGFFKHLCIHFGFSTSRCGFPVVIPGVVATLGISMAASDADLTA